MRRRSKFLTFYKSKQVRSSCFAYKKSVSSPHLRILFLLVDINYKFSKITIKKSVSSPRLRILFLLVDINCKFSKITIKKSVSSPRLRILFLLVDINCKFSKITIIGLYDTYIFFCFKRFRRAIARRQSHPRLDAKIGGISFWHMPKS